MQAATDTTTEVASDVTHEATGEPMDEDWHDAVSTRALLTELTRLATELENQRKDNAKLVAKVDMLSRRLDGMQATMLKAGFEPSATLEAKAGEPHAAAIDLTGTQSLPAPASPQVLLPQGHISPETAIAASGDKSEVKSEPLAPLASGGQSVADAERRSPKDGGYFSRLVDKSEKMFSNLSIW
ncbi:hypothetical protein [uncultured Cohaesibacter sp.]|uniref:hypothetical protein n=1 Tax=uncultured Cohaesibacter sp. TaxID=1002546 RepID=UPI0029C8C7DD|nr:hypothetical protein [uncultured Cohaesibacter sp.]